MRKEFIVERQGKSFVLYAGLLDLAHENGLTSIVTTLVQAPSQDSGMVAICTATVCMGDKVFTGIGDASPKNLAPIMQPHSIRMAETRAKSRALRDAVNIGVSAVEELGPDDNGQDEESRYVETERPSVRNWPQEFKERAERMGYEGKVSALCGELVKKYKVLRSDYEAAMKLDAASWNTAIDALQPKTGSAP